MERKEVKGSYAIATWTLIEAFERGTTTYIQHNNIDMRWFERINK